MLIEEGIKGSLYNGLVGIFLDKGIEIVDKKNIGTRIKEDVQVNDGAYDKRNVKVFGLVVAVLH